MLFVHLVALKSGGLGAGRLVHGAGRRQTHALDNPLSVRNIPGERSVHRHLGADIHHLFRPYRKRRPCQSGLIRP